MTPESPQKAACVDASALTVVVPIYNGHDALSRCLSALQAHSHNAAVILIDDASTDERVSALARHYATHNGWEFIQHRHNLGFVKTANEGLCHSDGHTILLNADAIVTPYWLDAFAQVIDRVPDLATATPWSNNAEICSFPGFLRAQPVPESAHELAQYLYHSHQPQYPEIPTGVGFCLLITAQAKQRIGALDAETFGHGYGEENDFCLRARQAGLKNILLDNAYVAHIGNQSFADLGMKPDQQSMQRLLGKHPNYAHMIEEYIRTDPLAGLRCEIIDSLKKHRPDLARELGIGNHDSQ